MKIWEIKAIYNFNAIYYLVAAETEEIAIKTVKETEPRISSHYVIESKEIDLLKPYFVIDFP